MKWLFINLYGDSSYSWIEKKIFEASANEQNGVEFWLARDLQELLGYSDWRIFFNTIVKSKITCNSIGEEILDHFVDVTKKVKVDSYAVG